MNASPLVTVGVATYNGAETIGSALRSLEVQTYDNIEVIISDDGSTDDTEEICLSFCSRNPSWRYWRNTEAKGMFGNYRSLLNGATGPFFCFVDQDDCREPSFIEQAVLMLSDRSDLVGALTGIRVVWAKSEDLSRGFTVQLNRIPVGLVSHSPLQRLWTLLRRFSDIWLYGLYRTSDLRLAFQQVSPTPVFPALVLADIALRGPVASCDEPLIQYRAKGYQRRTSATEDSQRIGMERGRRDPIPFIAQQALGQWRICLASRSLRPYERLIACGMVATNLGASTTSRAVRRLATKFDNGAIWAFADSVAELVHPHDHVHFTQDPIQIGYLAKGWRAN